MSNYYTPEAREALLREFSHLIVDEAHHAPATTWTSVICRLEAGLGSPISSTPATWPGSGSPSSPP
ncbi:hypothetical protein [Streptomyces sp. NPDC093111]|uniref:hypothetical protein n=1 Tax=Streptomyces sp. NPDC093111 TaxID=3154978 RepID=UPI00342B22DF